MHNQFLKALMERFPNPGMSTVLATLPEELSVLFQDLPEKVGKAPELFFVQAQRVLRGIHPSWCEELVQLCPEALQPIIRSVVLNAIGKDKERGMLPPPPICEFLLAYLVTKWPERDVQGIDALEGSAFRWLATCDDHTLSTLAELLAVNSMVDIVRQIVEKKMLQKILRPLTPLQQRYLRSLLHRPARSATLNRELTALLLEDPQEAEQALRRKGFEELACAMKTEPPLLHWHVFHHMDREQASFLKKVMQRGVPPGELMEAKKHLSHAYQYLQKGAEKQ